MNDKQRKFAEEYVVDTNATQAAIRAGYSEKTAYSQGQRLLKKVEVKNRIKELSDEIQDKMIADATEVMRYLSSVLRNESKSSEIVIEGVGDGCSEARIIMKPPSEKDRLKAAELLGKRYGIFTDKVNLDANVGVTIVDDLGE